MRDEEELARALSELERSGGDARAYLAHGPDLSPAVRAAIHAAIWARSAPRPTPSSQFRWQTRHRFLATVVEQREREPRRWIPARSWILPRLRGAVAPLAIVFALGFGGLSVYSASAAALPESPLYPAKLAIDQLRVIVAVTPDEKASAHLTIAQERLREAQAEQRTGHPDVAERLLTRYQFEEAQVPSPHVATARASSAPISVAATSAPNPTVPHVPTSEWIPTPPSAAPASPVGVPSSEIDRASGPADRGDVGSSNGQPSATIPAHPAALPILPRQIIAQVPAHDEAAAATTRASGSTLAAATAPSTPSVSAPVPQRADAAGVPPAAASATVPPTAAPVSPEPTAPPPTATPNPPAPAPGDVALLRALLRQTASGDPSAAATLRDYLQSVRSARSSGSGWAARLKGERAMLAAALPRVGPAGRAVLQSAIDGIDSALGSATDQASAASVGTNLPTSTPLPHPPPRNRVSDQSVRSRR